MRRSVGRTVAKIVSPEHMIFRALLGALFPEYSVSATIRSSSRETADTSTYLIVGRGSRFGCQVEVGTVTSSKRT